MRYTLLAAAALLLAGCGSTASAPARGLYHYEPPATTSSAEFFAQLAAVARGERLPQGGCPPATDLRSLLLPCDVAK